MSKTSTFVRALDIILNTDATGTIAESFWYFSHPDEVGTLGVRIIEAQL